MVSTGHDAKIEPRDMTNQTLRQALASGWIFLASLALAACGSAAPASSASPGFTGYNWQVVDIDHSGKATPIPARLEVDLQFSPSGQFVAFDGIHSYSGTYRTAGDGFTTGVLAVSANGYVGHDPAILLAIGAMGSFGGGARAAVRRTGDQLVVEVGSYTLTCHRAALRPTSQPPG